MSFAIGIGANLRKSPYHEATVAAGVRSFSVYNHMLLPAHYGDPDAEYRRLTEGVAQWDVGAQRQVEIAGPDAARLVRYLTPRDLGDLKPGQGRYVPICAHDGLLINDPVLLPLDPDRFWLSVADSDIWLWALAIAAERGFDVTVREPDVSPLAIQGPLAADVAEALFGPWVREIAPFAFREAGVGDIPVILARSGWSKQGGFELYLTDGAQGGALWDRVAEAGRPFGIGPGAPNDVERIESGLLSWGADGRWQVIPCDPFEAGLGKYVDLDREDDFVGKAALAGIAARGPRRKRMGFRLDGPPAPAWEDPRPVRDASGEVVGVVSDAVRSTRAGGTIGVGLLAVDADDDGLSVDTPDGPRPVRVTDLPFV